MGINKVSYGKLSEVISKITTTDKVFLELGIQESQEYMGFKYLRDVWSDKFKNFISLDLHEIRGVTICDLAEYQPGLFEADIITNIGTSEHVEYETGQYNCWKNVHNWLKLGGTVIHELPEVGSWPGHCRYYVTKSFFEFLENYGYKIIDFYQREDNNGNSDWCVLEKINEVEFMDYETFFTKMHVEYSTPLSSVHELNNPKNLK